MSAPAIAVSAPSLSQEIQEFRNLCDRRYRFNNRFDVALTVAGIALGIAVVAAGTYKRADLDAILGAVVTAVVSAQRAFPFTQRAQFYRSLVGQAENLKSGLDYSLVPTAEAIKVLETLRLDFAQQLPRGSTSDSPKNAPSPAAPPEVSAAAPKP